MANVDIRVGKKDAVFFSANPTLILKDGQFLFNSDTLELFIGDGTTQLSALVAINVPPSSGVQSVTGPQVDDTDPNNPIVNPLGLIKIVDLNGDFFTDLATASAYVATFNVGGIISDESYYPIGSGGIYYFTVPQGSDFSGDSFFLSLGAFTPTIAYIVDSIGLITVFSHSLCLNNNGNNVFRNITFGGDSFNLSSGINIYNNVSADTPSFAAASGKFLFNGTVAATGIYLSDFFLGSTATILTNKGNLGNANLLQAESNGANVQYDGINLATVNDLPTIDTTIIDGSTNPVDGNAVFDALALKQDISSEQLASLTSTSISTTSSGNTDLTEMNTTVLANTTYTIDGIIRIGCNNTGGVALQLTLPSGAIFLGLNGLTTNSTTAQWLNIPSSATLTGSYCRINTGTGFVYVKGTIEIGATGGDLVWGFASVVNLQTSTVYRLGTQIKITKK